MSRRIVTQANQSTGGQKIDTYFDKLLKNIPADIVGGWVCVTGLINTATNVPNDAILAICFIVGLIITFFWTLVQTAESSKPPAWVQSTVSTVSFFVWVFALGGPFATLEWYRPLYGSLLLVLYTFVAPLTWERGSRNPGGAKAN